MKKLLVLLAALLVVTGCASKSDGDNTLTVATSPDYPPYEFHNKNAKDGELPYLGSDIELAKYIADKMGKELVIQAVEFPTIPAAISAKKYDLGISGFTYEAERAKQVDFSISYDTSESACQGILVKATNESKYNTLEDFANVKIGAQNASAQLGYVNEQLPDATQQLVSSLNDGVLQLKNDKIDALAISCASGESVVKSNSDLVLSEVKFAINPDDGQMVIVPKGSEELLKEINAIIEEINEKGLYVQWYEEAKIQAQELGLDTE